MNAKSEPEGEKETKKYGGEKKDKRERKKNKKEMLSLGVTCKNVEGYCNVDCRSKRDRKEIFNG